MKTENWFVPIDSQIKQTEVPANSSQNVIFSFLALNHTKNGKQRVTAIGENDSDAVEKSITVRPDGQEIIKSQSEIFKRTVTFDLDFPTSIIPNTQTAEVKLYPNLMAHITESVEGLLQRPYGCAEQTISSTYPNLMILRLSKSEKLKQKAKEYLQKGYNRLIAYQSNDGGFSYWGKKETPDIALTAYALKFLTDAKNFIEVDQEILSNAKDWLLKQQRPDGSWTKTYNWEAAENKERTNLITAYVISVLARLEKKPDFRTRKSLEKGLDFLKRQITHIEDPYVLSLIGTALLESKRFADAVTIAEKLKQKAIVKDDSAYWDLKAETAFYGWGIAGRMETTGSVLEFLSSLNKLNQKQENASKGAKANKLSSASSLKTLTNTKYSKGKENSAQGENLISKGAVYLVKNKDRYGVWYSTQATIKVLEGLLKALDSQQYLRATKAEIILNGEKLKEFDLTKEGE
ncbi:MAG: hypothetical protein ACK419_05610, partial [Pyrinomonadaceae bacterium]